MTDSFEGDKMVLIISILLLIVSFVAISSSTSSLVTANTSRESIMKGQIYVSLLGAFLMFATYKWPGMDFFKIVSQFGFAGSMVLLLFLRFGPREPEDLFIRAGFINKALRVIVVGGKGGFQVHVFEIVKVAMIMYLAWAVNALQERKLFIANKLSESPSLKFLGRRNWQVFLYIMLPLASVLALCTSSNSMILLMFVIGMLTCVIGGLKIKDIVSLENLIGFAVCIPLGLMLYSGAEAFRGNMSSKGDNQTAVSVQKDKKKESYSRGDTFESRFKLAFVNKDKRLQKDYAALQEARACRDSLIKNKASSAEIANARAVAARMDSTYRSHKDAFFQQLGAKIAISQGFRGPGNSRQKYIVPVMFEDFMFSFICEEYGFIGALVLILLFGGLLARGSLIAKNCDEGYGQTVVAGLVLLISGQAALHMLVNVNLLPMTGQTLPIISHGASALIAFCIALGVILSMSRLSKERIDKITLTTPEKEEDKK